MGPEGAGIARPVKGMHSEWPVADWRLPLQQSLGKIRVSRDTGWRSRRRESRQQDGDNQWWIG